MYRLDHTAFFRHKLKDEPVTKSICSILQRHTEGVAFFCSADVEKGANWHLAIAEYLTRSSFLVLVSTDTKEDWGWCLYEIGFFDALTRIPGGAQTRRIYCLHSPAATIPSPIVDLQQVPAIAQNVSRWLEEIFDYTNQTKREFREDISTMGNRISRLLAGDQKNVY